MIHAISDTLPSRPESSLHLDPPASFTPNELGQLEITRSAHALLLTLAHLQKAVQGLVTATSTNDRFIITGIEPVQSDAGYEAAPDWRDRQERRARLETAGEYIIGEFRTDQTTRLSPRDQQNMQYHFFIHKPHLQLISTQTTVAAFVFNGEDFLSRHLNPHHPPSQSL